MKKGILKRKILSIMLVVSMLANLVPVGANKVFAADLTYDDFKYTVLDDGTIEITDYTGDAAELIIPSEIRNTQVTKIGIDAFKNCSSLEYVEIPDVVTSMGQRAFEECRNLKSIKLSNNLTYIINRCFYNCTSLTSIDIPEGVTEIDSHAFYCCNSLESVELPEGLSRIDQNAFYACNSLKSIELPKSLTYIGGSAFYGCAFESIEIPDGITNLSVNTFTYCRNLKRVKLPESLTTTETSVFVGCSSLESIEIPERLTTISAYVFKDCSSLECIKIPESVTRIGGSAFEGCNALEDVYYTGTEEKWDAIDFTEGNGLLKIINKHFSVETILVERISLNKTELYFGEAGAKKSLQATVFPKVATDKTIEWSSSNKGVVTVDDNGTLTAVDNGTATVTAKARDSADTVVEAKCTVTVNLPPQGTPSNPKYNEDTNGTEWNYIYFGSYPQTEVTGDELAMFQGVSFDKNGDAWIDGTKYRRIEKSDTNSQTNFGNASYRYFKWERIKWRVLKNDGDTMFIMADKGIDCKNYHEKSSSVTWEGCSLRNWLNDTFYYMAFDSNEQKAIIEQNVENEDNPEYGADGGDNTKDNIYLLSLEEVTNPDYGFSESMMGYGSRHVNASDYAYTMGALGFGDNHECYWWLRTPGEKTNTALVVNSSGMIYTEGSDVIAPSEAVVPVMHISLSSDNWYETDDGTSGSGGSGLKDNTPSNPKYDGDTDTTEWSYVYFGSYPQTEVTGSALSSAITEAKYDKNGDAWVNGVKYRRISKSDTNNSGNFGNNTYRYFKWERIKWRVLQNDGDTLFVLADQGIDCKNYNEKSSSITWEGCSLRNWLNSTFYSMAFSLDEQKAIIEQNVENKENVEYGITGGNTTKDKLYLLSVEETMNLEYGFFNDKMSSSTREVNISDYAYSMGVNPFSSVTTGYENKCGWWLRSFNYYNESARYILGWGAVDYSDYGIDVDYNKLAVVPAMHISLSSDKWYTTDDGTSGEGGTQSITIITNPASQTIQSGKSVTFSVIASGGTPSDYTYQWYYSSTVNGAGNSIAGATASSYKIASVNTGNAGYYYCIVSDRVHSGTSGWAKLTVTTAAQESGTGTNTGTGTGTQTENTAQLSIPKLTVKLTAVNAVKLTWNKVNGATGYYVYRRIKGEKDYKLISTVTGTSYADKKLKKGKTYEYIVDAYNKDTRTKSTTAVSKKIIGKLSTPKQKPIIPNAAKKKFTISWKPVKNAQKMIIYRSYNGGKFKKWKTVSAKKGKVVYSYANFPKGTYRFQLQAYYKADGKTFKSSKSPKNQVGNGFKRN